MSDIADFLLETYFPKFKDVIPTPTKDELLKALEMLNDRMVVFMGDKVMGVAIYLTLTDETYAQLEDLNIEDMPTMQRLINEQGKNIHFVLVSGHGVANILKGISKVKADGAKTVSWWSPDRARLHRYNFN